MINYKITERNFELILFQAGAILTLELENQATQFYNTDCENVEVYLERLRAINSTELAIVTLGMATGNYSNRHAGYVDGLYTIYADVWANSGAKKNEEGDLRQGDTLAGIKRNRITGIVQAVFEDPIYKTLGFEPGSVGNVRVNSFEIGNVRKGELDADNTTVSRVTLEFKAAERSKLLVPPELAEALTKIKLNKTNLGFKYEYIA